MDPQRRGWRDDDTFDRDVAAQDGIHERGHVHAVDVERRDVVKLDQVLLVGEQSHLDLRCAVDHHDRLVSRRVVGVGVLPWRGLLGHARDAPVAVGSLAKAEDCGLGALADGNHEERSCPGPGTFGQAIYRVFTKVHTRYILPDMSIKHGLLALLERGPAYGYQLRSEFESSTGATWPLNIGQVYTTLARLERDGFVRAEGADDDGRVIYAITGEGRVEVDRWFVTPVQRADRPRDELAIKLAMAITTPGVDVPLVVQTQRTATLRSLQDLTRLKARADEADLSWLLVVESMIFQAEAEVRWLDHCEARVVDGARPRTTIAREAVRR